MNWKKVLLFYLVFLIASLLFTIILSLVNHSFFIENTVDAKYQELFNSKQIPIPDSQKKEIEININIDWPIEALIFHYLFLSIYWYLFGFLLKKKFSNYPIILFFSTPLLVGIIVFDNIYIVMFFLSVIGYHCTKSVDNIKKA